MSGEGRAGLGLLLAAGLLGLLIVETLPRGWRPAAAGLGIVLWGILLWLSV